MTAGQGISHAERPGEDFDRESELFGIQSWIALPDELQEIEPDFAHFTKDSLPGWRENGVSLRLIMGEFAGRSSPVTQYSRTLYVDITLEPSGEMTLSAVIRWGSGSFTGTLSATVRAALNRRKRTGESSAFHRCLAMTSLSRCPIEPRAIAKGR